jgi:hypothetical protein
MSTTEPTAPAPDQQPQDTAPESATPPVQTAEQGAEQPNLQEKIAALESQLSDLARKANSGQLTLAQQDDDLAKKVQDKRDEYEDWPQRGDDRAQPWDLRAHDLPQPGVTRDYLPGGQPDELSPVQISHSHGLLAPGMAGPEVAELAGHLATLGYPTSVSKGTNHAYSFDDSITAAVAAFKRDFGAKEDPSAFPASHDHSVYVGPWLWEAVIRAARAVLEAA